MIFPPEWKLGFEKPNVWSRKTKYVRTDAWRGYVQPVYAVAGANDTGMSGDSECPTNSSKAELAMARKVLKESNIPARIAYGESSNVFCFHRYLTVPVNLIEAARGILNFWYQNEGRANTRLLYLCN
jgi:hypothetical protein